MNAVRRCPRPERSDLRPLTHLRFRSRLGTSHTAVRYRANATEEDDMGFGKGALLWMLGVPLPIILLLAVFWHH